MMVAADFKIIGIGGTNGSGKDSLGQMLEERRDWLFVSVTDIMREELKKRGKAIERENLRALSTEWHHKYGSGALTDIAVKEFKSRNKDNEYKGLVIASLRRAGEVERVHDFGGIMAWVDAEPKIRYERTNGRGRSAEDQKTYSEFLADEKLEMEGSSGHTLNMSEVKKLADIFLENNGSDIEKFKDEAEKALIKYL
jgi:dephospho-CoA kinase